MRWARAILLVVVLPLVAAGCGDADNTQYLPIGSRCSRAGQCGTSPYACNAQYPNGYCEKPCKTDGDCPADAICNPTNSSCRRKCKDGSECRLAEGYACVVVTGSTAVCEPGVSSVDGGSP